jgi:hypothetical protein
MAEPLKAEAREEKTPAPEPVELPAKATEQLEGEVVTQEALRVPKDQPANVYGLKGGVGTPDWGIEGNDPYYSRDDDLLTAWICTPTGEKPCALGVAFPEPAKVHMVRIFGSAGPTHDDHLAHARPKTLRIHTDAGFLEGTIEDGRDMRYVVLPEPVQTSSVTVEVVEIYEGETDQAVHIGEIEVFGSEGGKREPYEFDAGKTLIRFDKAAWSGLSNVTFTWIEQIDGKGGTRRLFRGTGLVGNKGDRLWLVERLKSIDYDNTDRYGSFVLIDRETRQHIEFRQQYKNSSMGKTVEYVMVPLIHPEGMGFFFATGDLMSIYLKDRASAIVIENDSYKFKKRALDMFDYREGYSEDGNPEEKVAKEWGFTNYKEGFMDEDSPLAKDIECKKVGKVEALGMVNSHEEPEWLEFRKELKNGSVSWEVCTWGDHRILLTETDPCYWKLLNAVFVLDGSGAVTDARIGVDVRMATGPDGLLLVELRENGSKATDVFVVSPEGKLDLVYPKANLLIDFPGDFTYCN